MRYFIPDTYLPGEQPNESELTDKFGGLPTGLPPEAWPVCADCGMPQSFGAQFEHDAERIDLGRPGRRIYLFQCGNPETVGGCETWSADSGANAAIVVEPEDLVDGMTERPHGAELENEVVVGSWLASDASECSSEKGSRLGGEPFWVQSDDEIDGAKWRFLGQLNAFHKFLAPPRGTHPQLAEEEQTLPAANYGDGIAYFFLERDSVAGATPQARVFWQC